LSKQSQKIPDQKKSEENLSRNQPKVKNLTINLTHSNNKNTFEHQT